MLDALSAALARTNPKAYRAHFGRMSPEAQQAWVGQLTEEAHRVHLEAVGEAVVLGLVLSVTADGPALAASVGGGTLRTAHGSDEVQALQQAALARAQALGGAVRATGLVQVAVEFLGEVPWHDLGWQVQQLELSVDPLTGALSWRLRGALPGAGEFWSALAPLDGPRAAWEPELARIARSLGASFTVSQG